jgi:multidrug efflux system outer membrane protein
MRPERVFISVMIAAFLLSGCITVGPDYKRPKVDTPDAWPGGKNAASVPVQWWRSYNDPVLDSMVEEALAHNTDLALAIARVDEARAVVGVGVTDKVPVITDGCGGALTRI